jgi:hypothetical protein
VAVEQFPRDRRSTWHGRRRIACGDDQQAPPIHIDYAPYPHRLFRTSAMGLSMSRIVREIDRGTRTVDGIDTGSSGY